MRDDGLRERFYFFGIITSFLILFNIVIFSTTDRLLLSILSCLLSCVFIFFCYRVSIYSPISDNKVRLGVMTLTGAVCLTLIYLPTLNLGEILITFVVTFLRDNIGISLPDPVSSELYWPSLLLAATVFISVMYLILRNSGPAAGTPPNPLPNVLPEATDRDRLALVKRELLTDLDHQNNLARWSETFYVPLQAQVQVIGGQRARNRVVDLLTELRRDKRASIFLVLGDPGSGKSVSMRKLARDILTHEPAGRIPIYINLKEWRSDRIWTEDAPPSTRDFDRFIKENLQERIKDFSLNNFLFQNNSKKECAFDRLRQAGQFFFILDSFDEIPAVLEHDETHWMIDRLSQCLASYIVGGIDARGVIASRLFRKPTIRRQDQSILEIRPFTTSRVVEAIKKSVTNPDRLISEVMTRRPDLGAISKNPFLLNLVTFYYEQTREIPPSQRDMFEKYFETNIEYAKRSEKYKIVDRSKIYAIGEGIAFAMFQNQYNGLEISKDLLKECIDDPHIELAIDFLIRSRIARSNIDGDTFSFSHRRFNEYFLVRGLSSGRISIPYDAIQTDNKWRDTMVLFAEIAEGAEVDRLTNHAWNYAKKLGSVTLADQRLEYLQARHALRFLTEGFRGRPCLIKMRNEISEMVSGKVNDDIDLIEKKTLVDSVSILEDREAFSVIETVLKDGHGWIAEGAVTAARYLGSLGEEIGFVLYKTITKRPALQSITGSIEMSRILSTNQSTRFISNWLRSFVLEKFKPPILLMILYTYLSIYNPFLFGIAAAVLAFSFFLIALYKVIFALSPDEDVPEFFNVFDFASFLMFLPCMFLIPIHMMETPDVGDKFVRFLLENKSDITIVLFLSFLSLTSVEIPVYIKLRNDVSNFAENLVNVLFNIKSILLQYWKPIVHIMIILSTVVISIWIFTRFGIWFVVFDFVSLVGKEISQFSEDTKTVFGMAGVIIVLLMLIFIQRKMIQSKIYYSIDLAFDFFNLRRIKGSFEPKRASVAEQFTSFRTSIFRSAYVRWLDNETLRDYRPLQDGADAWPENRRPQFQHDPASVELARLDARWWGLD